ncbi:MAG: DUF5698 domain-containing protein [Bacilli bacterium]
MGLLFLCIKVFFARILDVSMGTLRTIITVKGKILYASIVGFFEVLIWFVVVKEVLNTDNNSLWIAISYSLGFATGTYIGGLLSNRLIKGNLNVQIITDNAYPIMVDTLRKEGYAVTVIDVVGKDTSKEKDMLFIEINNKSFDHLKRLVKKLDHDAFIVVNETKYVQNGFINNIVK